MSLADGPECRVCRRPAREVWATATDVEYGTTPEQFRYYRCEWCDCLSIDPLPADRLDQIYPPTYYSFGSAAADLQSGRSPVTRVKAALDKRMFRRALRLAGTDSPRVLDVGGGTGDIAAGLLEGAGPGARGTVVDFDEGSIEVARARGLEGFVGRFEDYSSDERFDIVLLLNLIEHVADPIGILAKAANVLTPTGVIWLQTPNFRSLDARLFRNRSWAGLHCPRHWVVFSDEGLRAALSRAGLQPLKFEYTQAGAFWAASLLASLRARRKAGSDPVRPLVASRLFLPLAAAGAAFDFVTRPLRRTSQVVVLARPAEPSGPGTG